MKQILLETTSTTGWTGSSGVTFSLLENEYLSNNRPSSLCISFPASSGAYAEYAFSSPVSVSSFKDLVFHAVSKNLGGAFFRTSADFSYKIEVASGHSGFYAPVTSSWQDVSVGLRGVSSISKIRITNLKGVSDHLVVSTFLMAVQEFPLDILVGLKEQLEFNRGKSTEYLIGFATVSVGDTSIKFLVDVPYIDKYVCIRIVDETGNTEIHQIDTKNALTLTFSDLFDGTGVTTCEGLCSVYLYIPVEFGKTQKEILVPSISVWGMEPIEKKISTGVARIIDQFTVSGEFSERIEGIYQEYDIIIDCEARQSEVLASLAYIVRKTIGNRIVWINGRPSSLDFTGSVTEILPTEEFNIIPKLEYVCQVEVKEDVFDEDVSVAMTSLNVQAEIL